MDACDFSLDDRDMYHHHKCNRVALNCSSWELGFAFNVFRFLTAEQFILGSAITEASFECPMIINYVESGKSLIWRQVSYVNWHNSFISFDIRDMFEKESINFYNTRPFSLICNPFKFLLSRLKSVVHELSWLVSIEEPICQIWRATGILNNRFEVLLELLLYVYQRYIEFLFSFDFIADNNWK